MKNINLYRLLLFVPIAGIISSCWDNVEDIQGSGGYEDPTLAIIATDASDNVVSGATVEVYASFYDYATKSSVLASATTDSEGMAVFGTDVLGTESASFYFSVYSAGYSLTNWDETVSTPVLLFNSGQSEVSTTIESPSYSTSISGDTSVISGTSVAFSVAEYPGAYSWSIDAGDMASFTSGTDLPYTIIEFEANSEDATYTVSVSYVSGSETVTLDQEIFVSKYCAYDESSWNGLSLSGTDPCWGISISDPSGSGVIVDGNTITFPADADGNPYFFNNVYAGWGETFQAGYGNEGDVIGTLSDDGSFVIEEQYMGQTLPGPYDYWVRAEGTFDQCTNTIYITEWDWSYDEFETAWYGAASGCTSTWTVSE